MIKGEDVKKTSEITLRTAYDINKDLVQKYEKTLTDEELQTKMLLFKQLANTNLKNAQITIAYVGNSNPRILQDLSSRYTNFKSYIRYNTIL